MPKISWDTDLHRFSQMNNFKISPQRHRGHRDTNFYEWIRLYSLIF